jgi:hypothetical protein
MLILFFLHLTYLFYLEKLDIAKRRSLRCCAADPASFYLKPDIAELRTGHWTLDCKQHALADQSPFARSFGHCTGLKAVVYGAVQSPRYVNLFLWSHAFLYPGFISWNCRGRTGELVVATTLRGCEATQTHSQTCTHCPISPRSTRASSGIRSRHHQQPHSALSPPPYIKPPLILLRNSA